VRKPPPTLLGAPYRPPRPIRRGIYFDLLRGDLRGEGPSDAPIAWPRGRAHFRARPLPILCDELARAIRTESVRAIVHHWGISRDTVKRWRKALGVPRYNPGTISLWRELAAAKLHSPAVKRAARRAWRASIARRRATAAAAVNLEGATGR
jgi:hypothetical protein